MTTVAFDGSSVAGDTLAITFGNKTNHPVTKVIRRGNRVYAGAGCEALLAPYIEWFEAGADARRLPPGGDDDRYTLHLLVIDLEYGDHKCFAPLPTAPYPFRVEAPFAIGSGMDFALAAMACGKTAEEAVRIASKFDPNTGGRIDVIDLRAIAEQDIAA